MKHKDALCIESRLDNMEEAADQYVTVINHRQKCSFHDSFLKIIQYNNHAYSLLLQILYVHFTMVLNAGPLPVFLHRYFNCG